MDLVLLFALPHSEKETFVPIYNNGFTPLCPDGMYTICYSEGFALPCFVLLDRALVPFMYDIIIRTCEIRQ